MRFGSWQVGPSGPGDEVVPAPFQLPSPTWLRLGLGSGLGSGLGLGLGLGFQLPSPTYLVRERANHVLCKAVRRRDDVPG